MAREVRRKKFDVYFSAVPPNGTVVIIDGQTYRKIGDRKHITTTRGPGRTVTIIDWLAPCATCGDSFEVSSTLRARRLTRRCPIHRQPGRQVAR
jgi:hypothetical protein